MPKKRFAVVVSRFNEAVTERLLAGARACFTDHGYQDADVAVFSVPGAWELPIAALHAARNGFSGVVAIGCVVRGDTPHFDYVAGGAAEGLARVSVETGVPVAFGVLTTEDMDQALDRAGGKHGNKGYEAALTALEMVDLIGRMQEESAST
ncbi:MAG TPA: 6,7-dimethyl-8-ribityllumazine synthase [Longimicrobiales bacterium]|nr:6,7-dimethyl-8-ribityllumazine synthase [Longimicrobiales bacterium]